MMYGSSNILHDRWIDEQKNGQTDGKSDLQRWVPHLKKSRQLYFNYDLRDQKRQQVKDQQSHILVSVAYPTYPQVANGSLSPDDNSIFLICYLTYPRPTLEHYPDDSISQQQIYHGKFIIYDGEFINYYIQPMLITVFYQHSN